MQQESAMIWFYPRYLRLRALCSTTDLSRYYHALAIHSLLINGQVYMYFNLFIICIDVKWDGIWARLNMPDYNKVNKKLP